MRRLNSIIRNVRVRSINTGVYYVIVDVLYRYQLELSRKTLSRLFFNEALIPEYNNLDNLLPNEPSNADMFS